MSFLKLFKNVFFSYGGFRSVSQIISWFKTDFPVLIPDSPTNALISLWRLLEMVVHIQHLATLESTAFKSDVESSMQIAYVKMKGLTEKEVKEVDRDLIMRMLHLLEVSKMIDDRDLETLELEIYKKYIFSPYFEKKLKSLNDLKEFLERVGIASNLNLQKSNNTTPSYKAFKFTRYFTIDLVINWILEQKILENALKSATQIDILKRCQDIIKFLANYAKFPNNLLIFLWSMMEEAQYEDIKKGFQDILEELASLLDQEALDFIFGRIEEGLHEKIKNEGYFSFLRRFLARSTMKTKKILIERSRSRTIELNSIHSNNNEPENNETDEKKALEVKKSVGKEEEEEDLWLSEDDVNLTKFFGIDLYWKLGQDDSPFLPAKINECLDFFIELLKKTAIKVLHRKYFELCLDNIFANRSIYQSLYVMREILNSIQPDWTTIDFSLFLNRIQEKYGANLIDIILKEMIVTHQANGGPSISNGRFSHNEIYKMHLNLFQFLKNYTIMKPKIMESSSTNSSNIKAKTFDSLFNINNEHINVLWDLFVEKAHDSGETIEFLKCFFNDTNRNVSNDRNAAKCHDYVFELFCKFMQEKIHVNELGTITDEIFLYFFNYFQQCNRNHRNFDLTSETSLYLICEEDKIIGFQTLWELFLASEHEPIMHNCIQLLVAINSSLGIEIFPKRTEIFKKFLNKCLHYLREAMLGKKMLLIQKILGLIDDFLVSIEKKKNFYKVRNNNYIIIKSNSERYESFQFNPNLPIKYLRLRISEINEIPIDSFVIALSQSGVEITKEYDENKIVHMISNDVIIYVVLKHEKLESPKSMISDTKEFMRTFFEIFELNFPGTFYYYVK